MAHNSSFQKNLCLLQDMYPLLFSQFLYQALTIKLNHVIIVLNVTVKADIFYRLSLKKQKTKLTQN